METGIQAQIKYGEKRRKSTLPKYMKNKGIARIASINAVIVRTEAPIIELSNPPKQKN